MSDDLLPITLDDMIAELRRELRVRLKVYPKLVRDGRLTQTKAQRQVSMLEATIDKLEALPRDSGIPQNAA
jgi:hypothetical protein